MVKVVLCDRCAKKLTYERKDREVSQTPAAPNPGRGGPAAEADTMHEVSGIFLGPTRVHDLEGDRKLPTQTRVRAVDRATLDLCLPEKYSAANRVRRRSKSR